jgi:putative addiction module component (TIGR02574 family)
MSDDVADLARLVRALPAADRARLVDLLLDSLDESPDLAVEEAWRKEIRRRIDAFERGGTELFDADEVMAEATRLAP